MNVFQKVGLGILFPRGFRPSDKINVQGKFKTELWRSGKLYRKLEISNLVTNLARNTLLDTMFQAATQTGASGWYIGLIGSSGYTGIAPGDTASSHAGWTEATGYSESSRQAWGPGAASSQITTNASPAVFTINTGFTAKGQFIQNTSTKNSTSGLLWAAGLFNTGDILLANTDVLRTTYQVSS